MASDFRVTATPGTDPGVGAGKLAGRGKSPIRRLAIVIGSHRGPRASGRAAINEASLLVAASTGKPANLAASCHGSTSSLASAETTLSSMPLSSSPIDANRKSSNSRGSREGEAARSIFNDQISPASLVPNVPVERGDADLIDSHAANIVVVRARRARWSKQIGIDVVAERIGR